MLLTIRTQGPDVLANITKAVLSDTGEETEAGEVVTCQNFIARWWHINRVSSSPAKCACQGSPPGRVRVKGPQVGQGLGAEATYPFLPPSLLPLLPPNSQQPSWAEPTQCLPVSPGRRSQPAPAPAELNRPDLNTDAVPALNTAVPVGTPAKGSCAPRDEHPDLGRGRGCPGPGTVTSV